MIPGGFYGDLSVRDVVPLAGAAQQALAHRETVTGRVGPHIHHQLTADPVGFDDAAHDEFHDVLPVRVGSERD
ncbi:hypothetical protein GCM10009570_15050 [Dietzia natronolimnaea]